MQRKRKACRYVRNTRKGSTKIVRTNSKKEKGYSEELPDDNADFTDRGAPLWQYDPNIMRARSRFEGVSSPRNEWNRRLQTKTSLEQTSRTSTSKRYGGICSHHTHDAGKGWSKKKNKLGNLQRFHELILYPKSQTKRGSFTKIEPGDARAIRKPKNKKEKQKTKNKRGRAINQRRTRRCSYYKQAKGLEPGETKPVL